MNQIYDQINQLFKQEVEVEVKNIKEEFEITKRRLSDKSNELFEAKQTIKHLEDIKDKSALIDQIQHSVNKDNFLDFLNIIGLKESDYDYGRELRELRDTPVWFPAIVKYYPDKEKVLKLMKVFNIQHPEYASLFKFPIEYNKEEIKYILENFNNYSTPNSNHLSNNFKYFYESFSNCRGDISKMGKGYSSYFSIPLQLLFLNPFLTTDENFDLIVEIMKGKRGYSNYFFYLQKYQPLSPDQIEKMFTFFPLSSKLSQCHTEFINYNADSIKNNPNLARQFKDSMNTYSSSPYYFVKYPLELQIEYINKQQNLSKKIDLVQLMDISKEDKIDYIIELSNEEIKDDIQIENNSDDCEICI